MHVLSVGAPGGPDVVWSFDAEIVSLDDAAGLKVSGQPALGATPTGPTTLLVEYVDDVNPGQPWHVDASACAITFAGGAVLVDQDGVTEVL